MVKNKTQRMWKKAKKIIPGGNMLLSKRPEITKIWRRLYLYVSEMPAGPSWGSSWG